MNNMLNSMSDDAPWDDKLVFAGILGAVADICRNRHHALQLEEDHPGSHFVGLQSLGRSSRVECRLLPDTQRYHSGWYVSEAWSQINWCNNSINAWRNWSENRNGYLG